MTARYFFAATSISASAGFTLPSFQPSNEALTFALPATASSGVRTGP
jgi:hypothetical protein